VKRSIPFLILTLAGFSWVTTGRSEDNNCVTCHKTVTSVTYLEHNFGDWDKSVHSSAGVTCQVCHGGDPTKADAAAAHAGVLRSTDPKSPVYFTRIPETCGGCHKAELDAFHRSGHFKELQRTGKGPNCVTCHGSMANHVLAPRDLEATCTLCHKRPTQAYATLIALNGLKSSLRNLDEAVKKARAANIDVTAQQQEYDACLKKHQSVLEEWHTFDMPRVLKDVQELTRRARTAYSEVQIKQGQKQ
jgi:hypothetical protein